MHKCNHQFPQHNTKLHYYISSSGKAFNWFSFFHRRPGDQNMHQSWLEVQRQIDDSGTFQHEQIFLCLKTTGRIVLVIEYLVTWVNQIDNIGIEVVGLNPSLSMMKTNWLTKTSPDFDIMFDNRLLNNIIITHFLYTGSSQPQKDVKLHKQLL